MPCHGTPRASASSGPFVNAVAQGPYSPANHWVQLSVFSKSATNGVRRFNLPRHFGGATTARTGQAAHKSAPLSLQSDNTRVRLPTSGLGSWGEASRVFRDTPLTAQNAHRVPPPQREPKRGKKKKTQRTHITYRQLTLPHSEIPPNAHEIRRPSNASVQPHAAVILGPPPLVDVLYAYFRIWPPHAVKVGSPNI